MKNIILAGVGGKGEILTTKIITEAVIKMGFDVKAYNTTGINQRNGKVFSSIRIAERGEKMYSHNIAVGNADILLGLEPLEAYRLSYMLKDNALVILSNYRIYPLLSIVDNNNYPDNIAENLSSKYKVVEFDIRVVTGRCMSSNIYENTKVDINYEFIPRKLLVSNLFLLGVLAKYMKGLIPREIWVEVITENIPVYIRGENIKAFSLAYDEVQF